MTVKIPARLAYTKAGGTKLLIRRIRYLLNVASLYYSESGDLKTLAKGIGYSYPALAGLRTHALMTPAMAILIENAVGRDFVTREMLRPDIFLPQPAEPAYESV